MIADPNTADMLISDDGGTCNTATIFNSNSGAALPDVTLDMVKICLMSNSSSSGGDDISSSGNGISIAQVVLVLFLMLP